ncbi:MAG: polymerase subunit sigma-24 [Bacteroidetes bacterium]|jgi:RNA polymerase sigma-70 factor (ECF subfamily)|nr:polymerase subunit sigma-24 [Bacteroidota bacterium]
MSDTNSAFETLYKTYYNSLRNTANNIIGDSDGAHDIVQEVFLKLWHRKEELSTVIHQKAYLFRSVINASLSHLENKKQVVPAATLTKIPGDPDPAYQQTNSIDTTSSLDRKELEAKISRALNKLPPKCKAIFALSRFEDMKYREIAEHLGVSLKTVENQMGIALKKIRADLSPYLTREFIAVTAGISIAFLSRFLWPGLLILLLIL